MATEERVAPQQTLDVRALAAQDRHGALLSAFDGLAAGQSLVLVAGENPVRMLDVLQRTRKGLFEWSPLAGDPPSFRVEIARRGAQPGAPRRLTEALIWDHAHLDGLERRAHAALLAGDRDTAHSLYAAFRSGLNRHIRFEEEVLFPVFDMRAGLPHGGPTAFLRAEHREIRMLLESLLQAAEDGAAAAAEPRQALRALLADHDRKEESILYPGTDLLLSAAESDALVARIQAYPC